MLEDRLGDEGFDTVDARARLTDLLAVQNTYISTFQSLGALGLILVAVLPQMLLGAARVPLTDLATMLCVVLVAGVATGFIAVRATLKAPLVGALRGE